MSKMIKKSRNAIAVLSAKYQILYLSPKQRLA